MGQALVDGGRETDARKSIGPNKFGIVLVGLESTLILVDSC